MTITLDATDPNPGDSPLSSASLRYLVRQPVISAGPGPVESRPFGLRHAHVVETPVRQDVRYCPTQQVAVDEEGRPLVETMGKKWTSKSSTDGDEGPEENWGWEE
jgi:putative ATP-grasp target RiPP